MNVWIVQDKDGEISQACELPQGKAPMFQKRTETVLRLLNSAKTRASLRFALECLERAGNRLEDEEKVE